MTDNPTSAGHSTGGGNDPFTTGDPLTAPIGRDQPVDPRPEFAASLNNRLRRLAAGPAAGIDYLADLEGVTKLFYFSLPAPDIDKAKAFYRQRAGRRSRRAPSRVLVPGRRPGRPQRDGASGGRHGHRPHGHPPGSDDQGVEFGLIQPTTAVAETGG
jgi:hypothetical protein